MFFFACSHRVVSFHEHSQGQHRTTPSKSTVSALLRKNHAAKSSNQQRKAVNYVITSAKRKTAFYSVPQHPAQAASSGSSLAVDCMGLICNARADRRCTAIASSDILCTCDSMSGIFNRDRLPIVVCRRFVMVGHSEGDSYFLRNPAKYRQTIAVCAWVARWTDQVRRLITVK